MKLHDLMIMVRDMEEVIGNLEAREELMNAEGDSYFLDVLVDHINRDVALTTMLIDTRVEVEGEEMSLYEGIRKLSLISLFIEEATNKGLTDKIPAIIMYHTELERAVNSVLLTTDVPSTEEEDDGDDAEGGGANNQ